MVSAILTGRVITNTPQAGVVFGSVARIDVNNCVLRGVVPISVVGGVIANSVKKGVIIIYVITILVPAELRSR